MKICSKCKKELEASYFRLEKRTKSGLSSRCKECLVRATTIKTVKEAVKNSYETSSLLDELCEDEEFKSLLMNMGK